MRFKSVRIILGTLLALAGAAFLLWTPDRDPAELAARYLGSPEDVINVRVGDARQRLHVRDDGPANAPVVLFLHGFGSSLHTWEAWATRLSGRFRVVRLDLPGAGLSAPDTTGDYSDGRSLALIEGAMDHLGIARASIVGNSMGGRLAWRFAAARPDRVDKLVLIAPDGFASAGFEYGKAPVISPMLHLMQYSLPRFVLRMSLAPAYADPGALTGELLTRYHDLLLAPGARKAMLMRLEQTLLVDPVPVLRRIRAPTLVVWGEQDQFIPIANANDYLAAIPASTLVRLPGVGHLPQEEAPEPSLAPVQEFLSR